MCVEALSAIGDQPVRQVKGVVVELDVRRGRSEPLVSAVREVAVAPACVQSDLCMH